MADWRRNSSRWARPRCIDACNGSMQRRPRRSCPPTVSPDRPRSGGQRNDRRAFHRHAGSNATVAAFGEDRLGDPGVEPDQAINPQRVHDMWRAGFVAEVESLRPEVLIRGRTASRAVGYRQILDARHRGRSRHRARAHDRSYHETPSRVGRDPGSGATGCSLGRIPSQISQILGTLGAMTTSVRFTKAMARVTISCSSTMWRGC